MRRRRLVAGVAVGSLVAVLGYGTLDVYDQVPGILTRADHGVATSGPEGTDSTHDAGGSSSGGSRVAPVSRPRAPLPGLDPDAPVPSPAGLRAFVAKRLANPRLGDAVGVTVRDARTGRHLLDQHADEPHTPASTTKLLTAAAVATTLDTHDTFTTKVVRGSSARTIVLVAGGDSLLAPGRGDPQAVSGRAGLADLAAQVVPSLGGKGGGPVHLAVDARYAAAPLHAPGWSPGVVQMGFTSGVTMLGLSTDRATSGHPSSPDPVMTTAGAFRKVLVQRGVRVDEAVRRAPAPKGAKSLGAVRSAPIGDVLALALDQSDNSLTEQLARIAAVHQGRPAGFASVASWVTTTVKGLGINTKGVHLVDSCGLSNGTRIPPRVIADVLGQATIGKQPRLRDVLSRLPVAGLSGTLHDRFREPSARSADGIARAKTGSLPGVHALAGTVVDRDGRLLSFVLLADNVRPRVTKPKKGEPQGSKGVSDNAWAAVQQAEAGLDAIVARLGEYTR